MIWYLGPQELLEQIAWQVCHACEVYWVGKPTCWLCQMPSESGFPRLEALAAQNPIEDDADLLD